MDPIVVGEAEGEEIGAGPNRVRFLAEGPGPPLAVTDSTVPPGFPGPVRHRPAAMTDVFYVLEGTLAFDVGGERRALGPRSVVLVPPGVAHTFATPGSEPARFPSIYLPASNEQYVKDGARRRATGNWPSPAAMAAIASRYDVEPVSDEG